jgi:hypothetical protein
MVSTFATSVTMLVLSSLFPPSIEWISQGYQPVVYFPYLLVSLFFQLLGRWRIEQKMGRNSQSEKD